MIVVLLSLVLIASNLSSYEEQKVNEQVIRRICNSISEIERGKIFIKPEKLCLKSGRIYAEDIDGAEFPISVTFSSEIHQPYMQVAENVLFNLWKCECGAWNHKWDNPTHCRACGRAR